MPFNPTLPTWVALNAANSTSSTGNTDLRLGTAIQGGNLVPGDYFDLTNPEANQLSNSVTGVLYAGRYRWVQVDSGATAANVKTGTIGLMPSLVASSPLTSLGTRNPPMNVVTSYDQAAGGANSLRPVVFLNVVTPGNWAFVQELGIATVLFGALTGTPAIGGVINSVAAGLADAPASATAIVRTSIGIAIDLPAASLKSRILLQYVPVVQG